MGCLYAGLLARGGHHVTLIDYLPERAAGLSESGLTIEGPAGTFTAKAKATADAAGLPPQDLLMFCTKTHQIAEAAGRVKALVGPATTVMATQNGLGAVEELGKLFGKDNLLVGVMGQASVLSGPGRVRYTDFGKTYLGWARHDLTQEAAHEARLTELCAAFQGAGVEAEAVPRIEQRIWHKLIINAAINPLGALLRVPNGQLLAMEPSRQMMSDLVRETVAVARLNGILLHTDDYMKELEGVIGRTKDHLCSMLQDVLKGRRTEVSAINRAIGRNAEEVGLVVSMNAMVASLVEATEQSYATRVEKV
jgi:2-dehydropantoate 2-reductase